MFRELCGDSTLRNVILVTNMWADVSQEVGETREKQLIAKFFKPALDKSAQLARHHNTAQSAHDIIRRIMRNRPLALQIQRELIDENKEIIDTAAGGAINKELKEQIRRHQVKLEAMQEDMMKASEETRQELAEEMRKLQEEVDKTRMKSEGMASNYNEEKKRSDELMRQLQEALQERKRDEAAYKQERGRVEAAHKQQMDDLNRQLQESANASAAVREAMEKRLNELQHQWDNRPREGGGCLIM
jgi:chromosome segregation ATPase